MWCEYFSQTLRHSHLQFAHKSQTNLKVEGVVLNQWYFYHLTHTEWSFWQSSMLLSSTCHFSWSLVSMETEKGRMTCNQLVYIICMGICRTSCNILCGYEISRISKGKQWSPLCFEHVQKIYATNVFLKQSFWILLPVFPNHPKSARTVLWLLHGSSPLTEIIHGQCPGLKTWTLGTKVDTKKAEVCMK